jgi:hypothetical protein
MAERHNCPDHNAFRAAFTKSAQEPKKLDARPVQKESVNGSYKTAEPKWRNFLTFGDGSPGGVAHKVGSLHMEIVTPANDKQMQPKPSLAGENCLFIGTQNVYSMPFPLFGHRLRRTQALP